MEDRAKHIRFPPRGIFVDRELASDLRDVFSRLVKVLLNSVKISEKSEMIRELSGGCAIQVAIHCQSGSGGILKSPSKREANPDSLD
jgi:hypothetical protein